MQKKTVGLCLVIVVAVLALIMFTRGSGNNSSTSTTSTPAASTPAASAPAANTPAASEVSSGKAEYELSLAYSNPPDHPMDLMLKQFIADVNEKSNGRIKITGYGNMILGAERELIEGVQIGNIDMISTSTAPLISFDPAYQIFDVPFLFDTHQDAWAAMDGEFGQNILKEARDYNMVGLAWFQNGFLDFVGNRKIEKMEDFKGLTLRCMESKLTMTWLTMYGANPVPMAYSEMFTSIQNGTVDGTLLATVPAFSANLQTVADYYCTIKTAFSPNVLIMNKGIYDKLPPDLLAVVTEAATKIGQTQRQMQADREEECIKLMSDAGCETIEMTPEEKERLIDFARKTIYPKLVSDNLISQEVIDACLASVAAAKK